MLEGWLASARPEMIAVIEPQPARMRRCANGGCAYSVARRARDVAADLVIAVSEVARRSHGPALAPFVGGLDRGRSIMAGRPCSLSPRVFRAPAIVPPCPNTPGRIGPAGMTSQSQRRASSDGTADSVDALLSRSASWNGSPRSVMDRWTALSARGRSTFPLLARRWRGRAVGGSARKRLRRTGGGAARAGAGEPPLARRSDAAICGERDLAGGTTPPAAARAGERLMNPGHRRRHPSARATLR